MKPKSLVILSFLSLLIGLFPMLASAREISIQVKGERWPLARPHEWVTGLSINGQKYTFPNREEKVIDLPERISLESYCYMSWQDLVRETDRCAAFEPMVVDLMPETSSIYFSFSFYVTQLSSVSIVQKNEAGEVIKEDSRKFPTYPVGLRGNGDLIPAMAHL